MAAYSVIETQQEKFFFLGVLKIINMVTAENLDVKLEMKTS
jgi:hypothetical protein